MRRFNVLAGFMLSLPLTFAVSEAGAAERLASIALKSNETIELHDLFYAPDCKSSLKGLPSVEILDGPPGVTVSVKEAQVVPRAQHCAKPVLGGKLYATAGAVEDYSVSKLILRITYPTKDGDRKFTDNYELTLVP